MPHDPATASTAHAPPPRRAGRRRLAALLTVLAAGGLGHAGLLYWMGTKPTGRPHEGSSRTTTEVPATKPDESASELAAGDALLAAAAGPDAEGLSQAARHFAQAVRLREAALAAATDADERRLAAHALAVALERFGTVDLAQGFFGDAERSLDRAEALALEVAQADLVRSIAARRGEAALAERRPGDAMAHFSRALGDAPSAALLERLALAELAAGEASRAAATLRRSLALRGDDASEQRGRAEALRLLAQAESTAGRHDDGIAALRASHAALVAANASSLERSRAAERIADGEERMGRLVEAIASLRLARDELDGEDLTRSIDLTLRLGQAAAARGDRSGAREAAANALALAERSGGIDDQRRLRIGDLLRDAGDLDGAAEAYRSALSSMQAAAVAAPDDAELARGLARAQVRVAALALLRERTVEATAFADRARKTLATIVDSRREPEPTLTSELAAVDQLLGDIALADGRFEDAVRAYGRARGPRRIAVDQAPDSLAAIDDLGETLASLGAVALRIGRIEVAIRHLEERRALQASIAERPGAPIAALRGHASALDRLANALLATGDSAGAVTTFERSLAVREAMRDRDPEGPTTLDSLADAHEQLASMLVILNDLPGARRHADESLALRRRVLAMMPDDDAAVAAVAGALARHGDIAFALGDLDGAEASHRAALDHRLNAALRRPTDEALRRDVAVSHCNIGRVVGARGQAREAIERFEEAERLLKTIARRDGADDDLREDLDTVALALERMRSAESASP